MAKKYDLVSTGDIKKKDYFAWLGLNDSTQSIALIKKLEFDEIGILGGIINKHGVQWVKKPILPLDLSLVETSRQLREARPEHEGKQYVDIPISEHEIAVVNHISSNGKVAFNHAVAAAIALGRDEDYFESYKKTWLQMHKVRYDPAEHLQEIALRKLQAQLAPQPHTKPQELPALNEDDATALAPVLSALEPQSTARLKALIGYIQGLIRQKQPPDPEPIPAPLFAKGQDINISALGVENSPASASIISAFEFKDVECLKKLLGRYGEQWTTQPMMEIDAKLPEILQDMRKTLDHNGLGKNSDLLQSYDKEFKENPLTRLEVLLANRINKGGAPALKAASGILELLSSEDAFNACKLQWLKQHDPEAAKKFEPPRKGLPLSPSLAPEIVEKLKVYFQKFHDVRERGARLRSRVEKQYKTLKESFKGLEDDSITGLVKAAIPATMSADDADMLLRFAGLRIKAREGFFVEANNPDSFRVVDLVEPSNERPVLYKAGVTNYDYDYQYLAGHDLGDVKIPKGSDLRKMDLRGCTNLLLDGNTNITDAQFGELDGIKTRLSAGSNYHGLIGRENKMFIPENVDGLRFKKPKQAIPKADISKTSMQVTSFEVEDEPRVKRTRAEVLRLREERVLQQGNFDSIVFKAFLMGHDNDNPPRLSDYAKKWHGGNLHFLVGKHLEDIPFLDGTIFDVDMRGVHFRLPTAADITEAQFGRDDVTRSNTTLSRGSVISSKLKGWRENNSFTIENVDGIGIERWKKLVDPFYKKIQDPEHPDRMILPKTVKKRTKEAAMRSAILKQYRGIGLLPPTPKESWEAYTKEREELGDGLEEKDAKRSYRHRLGAGKKEEPSLSVSEVKKIIIKATREHPEIKGWMKTLGDKPKHSDRGDENEAAVPEDAVDDKKPRVIKRTPRRR